MQTEIADTIYRKVKSLPLDKQEEILEFIEEKISAADKKETRPIWEVITEISSEVPEEEWAKLPSDGSLNHDHYLYGSPKKEK